MKTEKIMSEASNFKIPEIPLPVMHKQADHSKCYACKKKIGLLGIRCKCCDCSYCNGHRLPEDHKCEGNFVEMAKEVIKKNNPTVAAQKIEKI
jgi:predicted nucleic acid binding AN1-type Zn finger protein